VRRRSCSKHLATAVLSLWVAGSLGVACDECMLRVDDARIRGIAEQFLASGAPGPMRIPRAYPNGNIHVVVFGNGQIEVVD